MNKGGLLAAIIVVGYIGFELYTVQKARYRMEAPYIFNQYVEANVAVVTCRQAKGQQYEKFLDNFERVRGRAIKELGAEAADASGIEQSLLKRVRDTERATNAVIDEKGCDDIEVWKMLRRFENFAKYNLG